jgi:hypothetical protein
VDFESGNLNATPESRILFPERLTALLQAF